MKTKWILILSIVIFVAIYAGCTKQAPPLEGLALYLPDKAELGTWSPYGDPQTAAGEDLFLLINGGAEIYYEYGFKNALIHSYTNENEKTVNVEMYEMEDAKSAYGAYTFKIGKQGQSTDIGTEGVAAEYYLNFWKGNMVVTLIGFDTDEETKDGVQKLARLIDAKIVETGTRPSIANVLYQTDPPPDRVVYLEGYLGFFNQYEFATENIFGAKLGAMGDYGEYRQFILAYENEGESLEWFSKAALHIKESDRFRQFRMKGEGFTLKDGKDNFISVKREKAFILINIGSDLDRAGGMLKDLTKQLPTNP